MGRKAISEPTQTHLKALRYISDYIDDWQIPPTRADICIHMRYKSPNAAQSVVEMLVRLGLIEVYRGCKRAMIITDKGREAISA